MWLLAGSAFHKSHQIGSRIPAMFVFYILFCLLHFPSFYPQSPESPILHHFLRHVSRLSSSGGRVYLPTGELTPSSANIAPDSTSCCPEGGTKCQTTPAPCHNRLYSDTPHHTIRAQPENFGTRASLVEIFFMLKTCHVSGRCATHPPLLELPGCSPNSLRAKNLCISPRFTELCILCVTNGDNFLGVQQKWKKWCISPNFTSLPCPVSTPLPPSQTQELRNFPGPGKTHQT